MRTEAIFVLILMFAGMSLAVPLEKRTDDILTSDTDSVEMRMEPLFDPDFHKEHISLFDDYGMKPIPPRFPPYLLHGQDAYEPNLDEEYY